MLFCSATADVLASLPRIVSLCTNQSSGLVFASDPACPELWELAASIMCAAVRQEKRAVRPIAAAIVNMLSDASMKALPARVPQRLVHVV